MSDINAPRAYFYHQVELELGKSLTAVGQPIIDAVLAFESVKDHLDLEECRINAVETLADFNMAREAHECLMKLVTTTYEMELDRIKLVEAMNVPPGTTIH